MPDSGETDPSDEEFADQLPADRLPESPRTVRKGWAKFGHAKGQGPGVDKATTSTSMDEIMLESVPNVMLEIDSEDEEEQTDTVFDKIASGGVTVGSKWRSRRAEEEQVHIYVTNISRGVSDSDLKELFSKYGRTRKVYIGKDRDTNQSRGFGYVTFHTHKDAALAMEKLQGHQMESQRLTLEWSKQKTDAKMSGFDRGLSGNAFLSGYGQALAQDTTSKVNQYL